MHAYCLKLKKIKSVFIIFSGLKIQDNPPDLPESGADSIYSYDNLPSKHWKKYIYASRFVEMVRAKTPKITYYSSQARCQLMENLQEFEMNFYDGGKIKRTGTGDVTMIDSSGHGIPTSKIADNRNASQRWEHYLECQKLCQTLENTLANLFPEGECFPNIAGRRPATAPVLSTVKENNMNILTMKSPNVRI